MRWFICFAFVVHATFAQEASISCQGVVDFTYVASPTSCNLYYQCIANVAYLLQCPIGYYFDRERLRCDYAGNVECVILPPETTEPPPVVLTCANVPNFSFLPNAVSCSLYYQCIDGTAHLLSCPLGDHFNFEEQDCTDPDDANCPLTPPPTEPTEPPTTPIPEPSCEGVDNFRLIPSPLTCYDYYMCISEVAFRLTCPRGLYFSERIQSCDYPAYVDCVSIPQPTPPPQNVTCDGVADTSFISSPFSCSQFFQCINGNANQLQCPSGMWFSQPIQTCDDPSNVDCDLEERPTPPTTPIPPTPVPSPRCANITEGSFIDNLYACDSFYQCINTQAVRQYCQEGLW